MIFTERIEKLLGANHIKEVIEEFLKFLSEVPQSDKDARNDANQLRGQVIILSGRFTDLNARINTNTIDRASANQERAVLINSFVQILNQLPSSYPDLNNYVAEKNEDDEWKEAQQRNTIEEYQDYFSKYPNGKYKAATIKLIAELEEVKQKQDAEIKRLASLEKERRENDKAADADAQKSAQPKTRQNYGTSGNVMAPAQQKSKAFLYIIIGALIGIIFIVILAVGASSDTAPKPVNNDYSSQPDKPVEANSEAAKAELKLAFETAYESVIAAAFYMNPSGLNQYYSGEALKTLNTRIETLIAADTYLQSILDDRTYKNITLTNNQTEGIIDVDETWSYVYFDNATKLCKGKQNKYRSSVTVYFKKTASGWMVTSFITGNEPMPAMVPCS